MKIIDEREMQKKKKRKKEKEKETEKNKEDGSYCEGWEILLCV